MQSYLCLSCPSTFPRRPGRVPAGNQRPSWAQCFHLSSSESLVALRIHSATPTLQSARVSPLDSFHWSRAAVLEWWTQIMWGDWPRLPLPAPAADPGARWMLMWWCAALQHSLICRTRGPERQSRRAAAESIWEYWARRSRVSFERTLSTICCLRPMSPLSACSSSRCLIAAVYRIECSAFTFPQLLFQRREEKPQCFVRPFVFLSAEFPQIAFKLVQCLPVLHIPN